ncbi:serine/threonine-protein kinase [Parazoarcus communis]|uniref:non-specific serine/threonine protein kinase n=1 Tax=Parazoarcus communis SWub3 = DSM 12120 TaxID=1121029 RepID=A0A323V9G5_9RHOO|nr:serine/threonine-protein kinase [Parazoarcus communis]NMG69004.1 protein kinase [Parazoarcus communis SWub3 = DSM 12120]PZA16868.1 serine/threonine protein kinase [Azoarcus communis] [Parazoarcus communis SWub3 = DSM 12120]
MGLMPEKIGKYRLVRELGRGATAVVYLAENPHYPEPVALKHVRFDDKARDEAKWNRRLLKLLKAEEAVSKRLDHPNIIRIFEAVVERDQAYVVMEYFPGYTLERYCSFQNLLPVHRVIGIVFKCCMALDHAFRQGIVHRDIKPANILIDDQDNVKITDFGLALNISKKVDTDSTFIMGVGSPAYMSPEQIKNYPLNQKTDLYSLGVVLFHLLTGRLPFRAANPAQLVYKIINADPPSVSQLNPGLPAQIDGVIRKALEKDLYSRYKNGAEFAKDLAAVRYKIVDDKEVPDDTHRFSQLRKQAFFTEFDDIEIWEILRICSWRSVGEHITLMRERDADQRFGIVLSGRVELSIEGRRILELGVGEVFGEQAWLDHLEHRHMMTVVTLEPLTYLEINPAALSLATEEVQERVRREVSTRIVRRLADVARALSAHCEPATRGDYTATGGLDLQLVES